MFNTCIYPLERIQESVVSFLRCSGLSNCPIYSKLMEERGRVYCAVARISCSKGIHTAEVSDSCCNFKFPLCCVYRSHKMILTQIIQCYSKPIQLYLGSLIACEVFGRSIWDRERSRRPSPEFSVLSYSTVQPFISIFGLGLTKSLLCNIQPFFIGPVPLTLGLDAGQIDWKNACCLVPAVSLFITLTPRREEKFFCVPLPLTLNSSFFISFFNFQS